MMSRSTRRAVGLLPALAVLVLFDNPAARAHGDGALDADSRIAYHVARLEQMPTLYPSMTELGRAYLDKAQSTSDPTWIRQARAEVERGLKVQETFEGYRAMMMIENYAHQFRRAVIWGEKAAAASLNGAADPDPEIRAGLIEAYVALGEAKKAERYLPDPKVPSENFEGATALAKWRLTHGDPAGAAREYERAAALARKARSLELEAWARVAWARAELASGRVDEADRHLLEARFAIHDHGESAVLASTTAEVLMARSRAVEALRVLETTIEKRPEDGELHWRAYRIAKRLGSDVAERHFQASERSYRRAIDAGEVHTLGALARLYLDAGRKLEEARALAARNLEYRRDPEALATKAEADVAR